MINAACVFQFVKAAGPLFLYREYYNKRHIYTNDQNSSDWVNGEIYCK